MASLSRGAAAILCGVLLSWAALALDAGTPAAAQANRETFRVVGVAANDVLNIRSEPNGRAAILGALGPNARDITILGDAGEWALIAQGNLRGYVARRFLETERLASAPPGRQTPSSALERLDGMAFQYTNEAARTVRDAAECEALCTGSVNCRALVYFKSRNLCRLMARADVVLERNPDAVSMRMPGSGAAPVLQTTPPRPQASVASADPSSVVVPPAVVPPQGRRVALVIGNARYQNVPALQNPGNDAQLLASTLRNIGFQSVTVKTDLTREQTIQSLRDFAEIADTADWAVVYYSGHGIELGGINYLIPVEARLRADRDIELETVDLGKVLSAIDGAKRLRLIVLDACRDNPFASQMRRTIASRSVGRGLASIEPQTGTLIAYAAKHGETALDGSGQNSPFVEALVKRMQQTPALEVRRLFDTVRDDVLASTNSKQQPFHYGSISGSQDFYFASR